MSLDATQLCALADEANRETNLKCATEILKKLHSTLEKNARMGQYSLNFKEWCEVKEGHMVRNHVWEIILDVLKQLNFRVQDYKIYWDKK